MVLKNIFLSFFIISVLILSTNNVYADEKGLGTSEKLDDLFKQGENFTNSQLDKCKIDKISATNDECMSLSEAGFDALQKSKDLAFSFHHIAESFIQFLSPIHLDGTILAIVSAVLGLLFFLKIGGKFGKHAVEIILVLAGIGLLFLVLGDSLQI